MALLNEKDTQYLKKEFQTLKHAVTLHLFTQQTGCDYCNDTQTIAQEVTGLSDKLTLEVHDLDTEKVLAEQYGITHTPALALVRSGEQDLGIRYFGIPAGYEFTSLIQDIVLIGSGDSGLSAATKQWAADLKTPLHLQVFVTPTCPYCPQAVVLAHRLAMESNLIHADMVEATEFPELAEKYDVMGVPRTVINEDFYVEGAVPEGHLLAKLKEAVAAAPPLS